MCVPKNSISALIDYQANGLKVRRNIEVDCRNSEAEY